MKKLFSNKTILFFTCLFSFFAVGVLGISTFAWFQQTFNAPSTVDTGGVISSGSNDLQIDGVTGYKYVYDDTSSGAIDYSSGHVASYGTTGTDIVENISQDDVATGEDVPLEGVGYYVQGDETWAATKGNGKMPWTYASAVRMEDKYGSNHALLRGVELAAGEKIEIYKYIFDSNGDPAETQLSTVINGGAHVSNTSGTFTVVDAGTYNIWINSSDNISFDLRTAAQQQSIKKAKKDVIYRGTETSTQSNIDTGTVLTKFGIQIKLKEKKDFQSTNDRFIETKGNNATSTGYPGLKCFDNLYGDGSYITTRDANYNKFTEFKITRWENNGHSGGVGSNHDGWSNPTTEWHHTGLTAHAWNYFTVEKWPNEDYNVTYQRVSQLKVYTKLGTNSASYSFSVDAWNSNSISSSLNDYSSNIWDNGPNVPNYTFGGWYKDAACTISATDGYISHDTNIYAKFIGTTSITCHIFKQNYIASSQSYQEAFSTSSSQTSYEVNRTTDTYFDIDTTPTYDTTNYQWSIGKWYKRSGTSPNFTYTEYTTAEHGPTSGTLDLYTYVSEKTVTLTFYTLKRKGASALDGSYASYFLEPIALNTDKISGASASTNTMLWGRTGNFIASNFITEPTADHYSKHGDGWSTSNNNDSTDSAFVSGGKTFTSNTTIYFKLYENKYPVTFNYKYFYNGGTQTFSNNRLPTTKTGTYYGFNSWSEGSIPLASVQDVGLTVNVDNSAASGVSTFYAFAWDNYIYTDAACTNRYSSSNHSKINPASPETTTNLYLKMVERPSVQLFARKPDNNNNYNNVLNGWTTIKVFCETSSGANQTDDNDTAKPLIIANYLNVEGVRFYTFIVPDTYKIYLTNNGAWTPDNYGNPNSALPINLYDANHLDSNGQKRTITQSGKTITRNALQLWGGNQSQNDKNTAEDNGSQKCKWHWYGYIENQYYLVGENLTSGGSIASWSKEDGIIMQNGGGDSEFPDAKAYAKRIWLSYSTTNQVKFKLYNDLGYQWLGATYLATDDDTTNYVEDDNSNNHNIVMKSGVSGYFNIYIGSSDNKIHIEDAEKASYIFFSDVAGAESTNKYKMGAGDETNYLSVLEQGISIKAGDTFAIRDRRRAHYYWYDYTDLLSSYSFVETTNANIPVSTANQIGDTDDYLDANTKLIKFIQDGDYAFYLTAAGKISIIKLEEKTTSGYYLQTNPDGVSPSTLSQTGAIKMRTISSGTNSAIYTGFHVTQETRYSVFSTIVDNSTSTPTVTKTGFTNFLDNVAQKQLEGNQQAFKETKDANYYYSGNYVTLNPGYYNVYVFADGNTFRVSFTTFNEAGFFAMNSIREGVTSSNGVFNSNTSLILRVAFTCSSESAVNVAVENITIGNNNNGLHSHLKYAFIYDPSIDERLHINRYDHIRKTYYDNLQSYSRTPTLVTQGGVTASSTGSSQRHYLYILIDYDPSTLDATALESEAQKQNDFYFVIKTTQA